MRTPFQDALEIYTERFGSPRCPEVISLLTGRKRMFADTASVRHAALFLLAHASRMGLPSIIFGPLGKMSRFELELERMGEQPGAVDYCWELRPWIPSELALIYHSDLNPIYASWAIWLK